MSPFRPDNTINLLSRKDNLFPKGTKTFRVSKFIIYLFLIIVVAFLFFSRQVLFSSDSTTQFTTWSFFKQLTFWGGSEDSLIGNEADRINILLLGMGGVKHDGPYLTDSIILASLKPTTGELGMLALPRDLLVDIPGHGLWKINNANHFGEMDDKGKGAKLPQQVVAKITDQKIPYYVRVDFESFEQIIDALGGVKIYVDKSFTDTLYPTDDEKYQTISFKQGWQTMDGATALKYVRSRHGSNGENSDFARSLRQQKLLAAIKKRIFSYQMLFQPGKINKILQTVDKHFSTNLTLSQIFKLVQISKNIDSTNIVFKIINDAPNGLLYATNINGAYVLQPNAGNWSEIQEVAKNIFDANYKIASPATPPTLLVGSPATSPTGLVGWPAKPPSFATATDGEPAIGCKIEIRNGTEINGLASRTSEKLKAAGFSIIQIGNAPTQNFKEGIAIVLNPAKADQLNLLAKNVKLKTETSESQEFKNIVSPQADILIILGENNSDLEI
ncbi:LCP family protein [Candidatus Falkowbacteria bacterium]|nr:LCP family protein [Candidatus Falkowbacteria bacterium]